MAGVATNCLESITSEGRADEAAFSGVTGMAPLRCVREIKINRRWRSCQLAARELVISLIQNFEL
jgi:hypothetical protein